MGNIYTRNKQAQPEMDYSSLNESRQGLKSQKLFNIIKQHGGFAEKTPSFYLHDMTDDDVIGVLPRDDVQKLMRMHPNDMNNYAIQHGFKINRGDMMRIIPLKDWTWIGVIERNSELPDAEYVKTHIGKLHRERDIAKYRDGAHSYQWSDTGKWGSPRAEEFYMRRTQNDIANQRRQRYGDGAVYKLSEHILTGLDEITKTTKDNENNNKIKENNMAKIQISENELKQIVAESVKRVLSEGQGWHYFKQNLPGVMSHNATFGDIRNVSADDWREGLDDTKKFIKYGDMFYNPNDPDDKPGDYYRPDIVTGPESGYHKEDVVGSKDEKKYRRTKRGLGAQIGRAAGMGALAAAGLGKMGYNTVRNAFKNKK